MARIVQPTEEWIAEAAKVLRGGGLVAIPTETVYGLAANAFDPAAVAKIFAAKGRPATNPLIVHVADALQAESLALIDSASHSRLKMLAEAFWPGPLTLVLPKRGEFVPDCVTAGGATVAIRVPAHPVAQALLREAAIPLAAPSANRSEAVSPTRAEHVAESLDEAVDLILDGGPCQVGLESTVLSLVDPDSPRLLRPGAITPEQIARVIGLLPSYAPIAAESGHAPLASPGQMRRHYAPTKPLFITDNPNAALDERQLGGLIARLGAFDDVELYSWAAIRMLPADPESYARELYAALREMDANPSIYNIVLQDVPDTPEWLAVRDRLSRAAAQ